MIEIYAIRYLACSSKRTKNAFGSHCAPPESRPLIWIEGVLLLRGVEGRGEEKEGKGIEWKGGRGEGECAQFCAQIWWG